MFEHSPPISISSGVASLITNSSAPSGISGLVRDLDYAEQVAVRILQHDKIIIRTISPGIASCSDPDKTLHLSLSFVCVEIKVQSASFS